MTDILVDDHAEEEERVCLWESALLKEGDRAELRARMKREVENLPPRFRGGAPS